MAPFLGPIPGLMRHQTKWVGVAPGVPHSKANLIAIANDTAERFGLDQITESVFESWIDEGLMDDATPKNLLGQSSHIWEYADNADGAVRKLLEFKSLGAGRFSQLRPCLWIFGYVQDFDRVHEDVQSEFKRLRNRDLRNSKFRFDHRHEKLTDENVDQHAARLPAVDSDLEATGFVPSKRSMVEIASIIYRGEGRPVSEILSEELRSLLRGILPKALWPEMPIEIGGALGKRDEVASSGEAVLAKATQDHFRSARERIFHSIEMLRAGQAVFSLGGKWPNRISNGFKKAAESQLTPDWIISNLALYSIAAYNARQPRKIPS